VYEGWGQVEKEPLRYKRWIGTSGKERQRIRLENEKQFKVEVQEFKKRRAEQHVAYAQYLAEALTNPWLEKNTTNKN
jgi:hypothetical protein